MDNEFLELVDETLKQHGIDTTDMDDKEKIRQFEELANKDTEVAEEVVEKVAEEAEASSTDEDPDAEQPLPTGITSPTKLVQ